MGVPEGYKDCKTVGQRLRWWRDKRGMTRMVLSKDSKIPYSTIAEIENGKQKASTKITALAGALAINPHYLATGEGDPLDLKAAPQAPQESTGYMQLLPLDELSQLSQMECELAKYKFQAVIQDIINMRPKQRNKRSG